MKPLTTPTGSTLYLILSISSAGFGCDSSKKADPTEDPSPGLVFLDYRNLDDAGKDGIAIVDLDPESTQFGELIQRYDVGKGVLTHHLYFNRDHTRLYSTALGGAHLYEVILDTGKGGAPEITDVMSLDVGANVVAENMFFAADSKRFYVTFMGGQGGDRDGSVGVFDGASNKLVSTISEPEPSNPASGTPFILWPHGISANEELGILAVTSTLSPNPKVMGAGNTVTVIDLDKGKAVKTYLVGESFDEAMPGAPVEVLILRGDLPAFVLVSTVGGGDVWVAPYDKATKEFGAFKKQVDGKAAGLGAALEFYLHEDKAGERELFVSFGAPGQVNVYGLDDLPELKLKRTIKADAGSHHMVFFTTESGREVVAIQNNLLNIAGLNSGIITVADAKTGKTLQSLNLPKDKKLMPESIESVYAAGPHDFHH